MPLGGLQHFTIEPQDLERSKVFYVDVLGLEVGHRPPLDFPGYWLYSGGTATVHLMGTRKPREGIVVRGTEKKFEDTGRFDHIAFAASDVEGVRNLIGTGLVDFVGGLLTAVIAFVVLIRISPVMTRDRLRLPAGLRGWPAQGIQDHSPHLSRARQDQRRGDRSAYGVARGRARREGLPR